MILKIANRWTSIPLISGPRQKEVIYLMHRISVVLEISQSDYQLCALFKAKSVYVHLFLFLMPSHIFQQISTKFGTWHPYSPRMFMGGKCGHHLANTIEQ